MLMSHLVCNQLWYNSSYHTCGYKRINQHNVTLIKWDATAPKNIFFFLPHTDRAKKPWSTLFFLFDLTHFKAH